MKAEELMPSVANLLILLRKLGIHGYRAAQLSDFVDRMSLL